MRPHLVIMTKAPIMGQAKTRLAADIGVVHAKRLYKAMISRVLNRVSDPRWDITLAVTPSNSLGNVKDWRGFHQTAQSTGSLSPRLSRIFSAKGPIAVIGTDCPQIHAHDIAKAFAYLTRHKAIFGPAEDGGFWLMAMNGPVKHEVFSNIRWSSRHTLADIKANIDGSIGRLRALTDIDNIEALHSVRSTYKHLI